MMPLTDALKVSPLDREVLAGRLRSKSIQAGIAQRARIVLLAADGIGTGQIAAQVGTSKQTVTCWKTGIALMTWVVWTTGQSQTGRR